MVMLFQHINQGRPQDFEGGVKNFFLRFRNLHVAKRHAAHGKAMRFARGVRGHAPPRKYLKMVQVGSFWCIYLNQIFYFKKFQKVPFFILFFLNYLFYINF